ncbi:TPA: hypothetical protein OZL71_001259 [Legionella pneumophila]|nr:hypothetical protein [Legionella pneumophila]
MSKKTVSQMEEVLMDKIEKTKKQLDSLQQKHKLEIGSLAYKYGLNQFELSILENAFKNLSQQLLDANSSVN